CQQGNSNPVTF
nr:immunoglobulin light chain junction region [Macaca mulatta]MOV84622.1 immunoglobulin light chain junction region [Macaca mulatta]MOV85921.1 immunoglobulin light chain junction region [Macaca mulatta]MOW43429.1 immunoglobulin light chain junction region [Macaca mulatta]MOX48481.1 immunoglobulin light chain junction region [Macaca mulatta]